MTDLKGIKKNRGSYWLGPVQKIHEIGEYAFVEYLDRVFEEETFYSIFINGESISRTAPSLDKAIVVAIAYKHEGPNSQAATYFMKMIKDDLLN